MVSSKKNIQLRLFVVTGIVCLLILQATGLYSTYRFTSSQLIIEANEAFTSAYQKEQTYRVPFATIVNTGAIIIESCGTEEVQIIRNCPEPDTVFYNNLSGHTIESFINHVFVDLREQITPINIYCLADLFSGMLYENNNSLHFVVERFNTSTGEILDSSLLPDKEQPKSNLKTTIVIDVSEKESLRAVLFITNQMIFRRMAGFLISTALLTIIAITCLYCLYIRRLKANKEQQPTITAANSAVGNSVEQSFAIGCFTFNPTKNELHGFGETIQLNKKENSILFMLCEQCGNVVDRHVLLQENWGSNGIIYSRSLDTYITVIRKYLKKEPCVQLVTIKGVGYKLVIKHPEE